jgi:hypothetical protein
VSALAARTYRCDRCGNTAQVAPREIAPDVVTVDVPRCVATQQCAIELAEMRRLAEPSAAGPSPPR